MNCPICDNPVSTGFILCTECHNKTPGRKPSARNAEIYKDMQETSYGEGVAEELALKYEITVKRIYQINQQVKDFLARITGGDTPATTKKKLDQQLTRFRISDDQAARLAALIPTQAPNKTVIVREGFRLLIHNGGDIEKNLLITQNGPFPHEVSRLSVSTEVADGVAGLINSTSLSYSTLARIAVELGINSMKG